MAICFHNTSVLSAHKKELILLLGPPLRLRPVLVVSRRQAPIPSVGETHYVCDYLMSSDGSEWRWLNCQMGVGPGWETRRRHLVGLFRNTEDCHGDSTPDCKCGKYLYEVFPIHRCRFMQGGYSIPRGFKSIYSTVGPKFALRSCLSVI